MDLTNQKDYLMTVVPLLQIDVGVTALKSFPKKLQGKRTSSDTV